MSTTRFRIGTFMTAVIYVAVGFATFRSDKGWLWESVVYTLTFILVRYRYYELHRFLVVGHSVMAVLFGLVGAALARSLDAGDE